MFLNWKHLRKKVILLLLGLTGCSGIIKCISLYGCETELRNFVCSWVHPVDFYIVKLKQLGFNTLRFPFAFQYTIENNWQSLDYGMYHAYINNMSVILDYHRTWNTHQGFDPFENISKDQYINAWLSILSRYNHYSNLIGFNAFNEYQGQDVNFVKAYHEELFTLVEKLYPDRFNYYVTGTSWAGNLSGMSLEYLPFHERIYYSVHKYSWSGTADENDWEWSFGNIGLPLEKIIIGEFGWMENKPEQVDWVKRFFKYLRKKNIKNTCYWTLTASHDTGNLYQDDCEVFKLDNYLLLKSFWDEWNLRV